MEITVELKKEEVEEAIRLWIREYALGSASPLEITNVKRKSNYEDSFTATLVKKETA